MNDISRVFIFCSAILLTACAEKDPQQFIAEGKDLFEKGEMESARVQFKSALQIDPKLAEAYYGLALIEEEKQAWPAMKKDLQDALAIDPDHIDAHVKLGLIDRFSSQLDKAKKHATIALKLNPDDIDAIMLDASIQHDEGYKDKALQRVTKILNKDPLNAEAILLQASMLFSEKRYDDALVVLNRGIEAHPDQLGLDMLRIRLHKEQKDDDAVIRDFEILISKYPDNKKIHVSQLKALADMSRPKQAEEALRKAINAFPDDVDMKLMLVINVERRDQAEAEKLLQEHIVTHPDSYRLKSQLVDFYIARQRIPDAQALLTEIVAADLIGKDGLNAKIRLADLAWLQKDKDTASKLVEQVLVTDASNSMGLLLRAQLRLDNKQADTAVSDLRIVLRDQPNSEQAMLLMAKAYLLQGELEVAESHWRKVLAINPSNLSAIIPLTSRLLKRGDAERAIDLLNKSIKKSPKNPALLELLVKLHVSQKDWSSAEASISSLKELPQSEIAVQILAGMIAQERGNYQQAINIYKEMLSSQPNAVVALKGLAQSYQAIGRRTEWIGYLKVYSKQNPTNILALNMLGRAYSKGGRWDEAQKTLQQALQIESKSPETYGLLAAILMQQGKVKEVTDIYLRGLTVLPDNPQLLMKLAKQYERTQHFEKAIDIYSSLLNRFPDSIEIVNNLAYLLVEFGADAASYERALSLVEGFKNEQNPYWLDTFGWVQLKAGHTATAIDTLQAAVSAVPDNATMRYHLAEAYYIAGDNKSSKAELEKAMSLSSSQKPFSEIEQAKNLKKKLNQQTAGV